MRLVKRIEVASVLSGEYFNEPFIHFKSVDNRNGIKAKLAIHVDSPTGPKLKNITVKHKDDLFTRFHPDNEKAITKPTTQVCGLCYAPCFPHGARFQSAKSLADFLPWAINPGLAFKWSLTLDHLKSSDMRS